MKIWNMHGLRLQQSYLSMSINDAISCWNIDVKVYLISNFNPTPGLNPVLNVSLMTSAMNIK